MSDALSPTPPPEPAEPLLTGPLLTGPGLAGRPSRRRLLGGAVTLGGAAVLAAATSLGSSASAATRPYISTRAQWQARAPRSTATILSRVPDHIVVHHTATANSTDYSVNHAYALSRSIQNFHMDGNGWADVGQQFTISRGGYLMEGRNRTIYALDTRTHVVGAQCAGHNEHTVGIECEGLYTSTGPPTALWNTLVRLCAYLCDLYGIAPSSGIVGHRNYVATACPGDTFYGMLPRLRQDVAAAMGLVGAAGAAHPLPDLGRGLRGPRRAFDHGPALAAGERG
ncbi:peptidoglycan recognition family protein [Actinomadura sp. HBU206391]|uniref:peptidoglycan recognition protein family protein n=1 Tax=Actinomadura sp. HBU206391 TaxID=2731692 RepID=UPI0016502CCE|nr:peptidoglycan recognition family protein [Actinomadura sp. HBU206391]MBC6456453.1 N-acetylmuramoyl-L-alanine amidase [Actinomadura sp. HBU206391]